MFINSENDNGIEDLMVIGNVEDSDGWDRNYLVNEVEGNGIELMIDWVPQNSHQDSADEILVEIRS